METPTMKYSPSRNLFLGQEEGEKEERVTAAGAVGQSSYFSFLLTV
jgi:hypothetical protein